MFALRAIALFGLNTDTEHACSHVTSHNYIDYTLFIKVKKYTYYMDI